jgi:putative transposase
MTGCCRRRCGGLKQLEDENNKLRKVVADLSLDKEMLQDALRRKL